MDHPSTHYNGTKGSPSFDHLDALLNAQHYKAGVLARGFRKRSTTGVFDINELAAIRTEDPRIFARSHRLVFRLLKDGVATGAYRSRRWAA